MPGVQQNMVVKREQAVKTDKMFMGMPIYTSIFFCKARPYKFHKRVRNNRLFKKWGKRYGYSMEPRTDANICGTFILCHPSILWRFEVKEFVPVEGTIIQESEHDIHL
jgi:hypothetical protein